MRDREAHLTTWYNQILELMKEYPKDSFSLSIYENDSKDASPNLIKNFDYKSFYEVKIRTELIGTPYYGSVLNKARVEQLAAARNQCLEQIDLNPFDKILWIEPDVQYDPKKMKEIIDKNIDIASPKSIQPATHSHRLYDCWATRVNSADNEWDFGFVGYGWCPVWSTFNCFCVYNAQPFKEGARFIGNDCDTVEICKTFRDMGYENIQINLDIVVIHAT